MVSVRGLTIFDIFRLGIVAGSSRVNIGAVDYTLPAASMGIVFDFALDPLGHFLLLSARVHPLRFILAVVTCNIERCAYIAYWLLFVALLAPESASPASGGTAGGVGWNVPGQLHDDPNEILVPDNFNVDGPLTIDLGEAGDK